MRLQEAEERGRDDFMAAGREMDVALKEEILPLRLLYWLWRKRKQQGN